MRHDHVAYFSIKAGDEKELNCQKEIVHDFFVGFPTYELITHYVEYEMEKKPKRNALARALLRCRNSRPGFNEAAKLVTARIDLLINDLNFLNQLKESGIECMCCSAPSICINAENVDMFIALAEHKHETLSYRIKRGKNKGKNTAA